MQPWLVVSSHLKNISQIGSFPQVGVKIKNIWNHHLEPSVVSICLFPCEFPTCTSGSTKFVGCAAGNRSFSRNLHQRALARHRPKNKWKWNVKIGSQWLQWYLFLWYVSPTWKFKPSIPRTSIWNTTFLSFWNEVTSKEMLKTPHRLNSLHWRCSSNP